MVDSQSNFSRDLEMLALSTRLLKLRINFFFCVIPVWLEGRCLPLLSYVEELSIVKYFFRLTKEERQNTICGFETLFKVPISWFGILLIFAVKVNGSDVKPGICVTVNTRSYRHTENSYIT